MSANERLVTITDNAASELREIMARENKQTSSVRMAVVRTHCMGGRGYSNKLVFEGSPARDDYRTPLRCSLPVLGLTPGEVRERHGSAWLDEEGSSDSFGVVAGK